MHADYYARRDTMSERGWRFCGTLKVDKLFSKDLGKFEEILVIIISIVLLFSVYAQVI